MLAGTGVILAALAMALLWGWHRKLRNAGIVVFWFFQAHAAAAVFFSLPALLAVVNRSEGFSPFELVAAGFWMVAFTGEVTADRQLGRFKADAVTADALVSWDYGATRATRTTSSSG